MKPVMTTTFEISNQSATSHSDGTPGLLFPTKTSLVGQSREKLCQLLEEIGVPANQQRMRASQLRHWMYNRGVVDFAAMTNISKSLRETFSERFAIDRLEVVTEQISADGTRKWLLKLPPDEYGRRHEVETVYIPEEDRGTLCISSQVGCTLTCTFCHTGTQMLVRNLTAGEIVGQVMVAKDRLGEWPHLLEQAGQLPPSGRFITNVVLMGMGEPLYNFDNVRDAVEAISDGEGLSISKRRITLSTSGVVPEIVRAGHEIGTMLAISLHATTDEVRNTLVPLNRKYPIAELLEACRNYPGLSNAKRITFEYVMIKGINDSEADARRLVNLLTGIPAKVNLIPFNPWPGTNYQCSDWEQIEKFARIVLKAGYASPVRAPRGRDILAACGQLKSASERMTKKQRIELQQASAPL
jgi:23S rRNA (adenine2503-C2)-methyltransferase